MADFTIHDIYALRAPQPDAMSIGRGTHLASRAPQPDAMSIGRGTHLASRAPQGGTVSSARGTCLAPQEEAMSLEQGMHLAFDSNLIQNIIWQYENAKNLKSLIAQKNNWYQTNVADFWQKIVDDFLNIQSATDWGLNLWGQILKVNRQYNINGATTTISKELYRRLILGKLQLIRSNGTVSEINKYLNFIFKDHKTSTSLAAYVKDNLDMSVYYVLNFTPNDEELALIYSREFLPTPAGVEDKIYLLEQTKIFGFYNTGFMPWNTAPFWDGSYI